MAPRALAESAAATAAFLLVGDEAKDVVDKKVSIDETATKKSPMSPPPCFNDSSPALQTTPTQLQSVLPGLMVIP